MFLNIKRFAAELIQYFPSYSYTYTEKGYVSTVEVSIECDWDITTVEISQGETLLEDLVDDTANWTFYNDGTSIRRTFIQPNHNAYIINFENSTGTGYAIVNTSDDFTPESEKYPVEINGDVKISDSNTKLKNVADVVENYFDELYPIGSVYKTTSNLIPFSKGTWSLIKTEPDRNYIGSQVIHTGASGSTTVGKTSLYGAYSYQLIDGVFANTTCPSGYHREYRLTFQGTTSSDTFIYCYINNIQTSGVRTYSGNTFRTIGATSYFKESDIVLETTKGYSQQGTNFHYAVTGTSASWEFKNATIHGYYVSDTTYYVWQRTA